MEWTSIIAAFLAAVATVLAQMIATKGKRKKAAEEAARKEQEISDRLASIEHKLDVHNGYAEKLGEISISLAKLETKMEMMKA